MHAVVTCLARFFSVSAVFGLFFTLSASVAHAQFTISDPKNVLDDLKRRIAVGTPFEQAMACGETKPYTAYHSRCEYRCSTSFCQSRCEVATGFEAKFNLHVSECSADGANIFGDNGLDLPISKTEYEADGHWIQALLRGAGRFIQPVGEWTIKDARGGRASRIVGGKTVPIPSVTEISLELSFGTPGAQTESFFILIDDSKKGLDQLLGFGEGLFPTANSQFFMIQKGVVIPKTGGGLF